MPCVALMFVAMAASIAKGDDPIPQWVLGVPWLHTGGDRPFQFRASIRMSTQDLVGYVSWVPPDRRCLILTDRADGLPLMIAVDGKVWIYDLVGGQVLLVRAEPEFRIEGSGESRAGRWRWGMRAEFPDLDSQRTLNVDLRSVIVPPARKWPETFLVDAETRTATIKYKDIETSLRVTDANPPLPLTFKLEQGGESQHVKYELDSFTFKNTVPEWHRAIDREALSKVVSVVAVADAANLSAEQRERIETVRTLLHADALFILRTALRDADFRKGIEKAGRFKLNFDEIRANDEKLRDRWQKALLDQDIRLPQTASTTKPEASVKDANHGTR
jgi:hypothetical protein